MTITVERKPHVVVTDHDNGWSMIGGGSDGDGFATMKMTHLNGARCTVQMLKEANANDELTLRVIGMLYTNPGEEPGKYLRKTPSAGDFVCTGELYAIAARLMRAWYEATFSKLRSLTIELPKS